MTHEENQRCAINYLIELKKSTKGYGANWLDLAIKALEQQPSEDCISREATIDAIYKKHIGGKDAIENAPINDLYACGLEEAVDAVENMPSVTPQQTGWIPVSERFPEENGRYLVTRGLNACGALWNRVYIINYSDLMGLKSERIWWDGNVGKSDFKRIDDVIAWMPLPEPFKESEE